MLYIQLSLTMPPEAHLEGLEHSCCRRPIRHQLRTVSVHQ